jgi:succinate dehydrogenase / fumarate reductase membrane anchor subunit
MSLRTPLARARGLGSAKEGVQHWWVQRVTAVALIPLSLWFVVSLIAVAGADYPTFIAWAGSPLNTALLVILLVSVFYHAMLGLQVVIEDYIHREWLKHSLLLSVNFALIFLGVIAVVSVLRITFVAVLSAGV